mmetsp:Transcript_66904/g.193343  ORF Transcript_66904/g.193343 Transcript_66904/m.193343 type:complete len:389 (-) Transcript_66904:2525-3691(-)
MLFFEMWSFNASTVILVMLATMNRFPPSTVNGADSSDTFSMSASKLFIAFPASCRSIFATNFCSCSLAMALAFADSTCKALIRETSLERSCVSPCAFLSFRLSRCLSAKNLLARSTFSCACLSASPNFSHNSWATSAAISSELPSLAEMLAAASAIFFTASSASSTFAAACCWCIVRFLLSVSLIKDVSLSEACAPFFANSCNSLPPLLATTSRNFFISLSCSTMKARASLMPRVTASAAASQSAMALTDSSSGSVSIPLRYGTSASAAFLNNSSTASSFSRAWERMVSHISRSRCSRVVSFISSTLPWATRARSSSDMSESFAEPVTLGFAPSNAFTISVTLACTAFTAASMVRTWSSDGRSSPRGVVRISAFSTSASKAGMDSSVS